MKDKLVAAIVGAVVSAFLLTLFAAQPQVPTSKAQQFFDNYYREVIQGSQRKAVFREDLTSDFQKSPGGGWSVYDAWWKTEKRVVVNQVHSVPGNPLEFTVWLPIIQSAEPRGVRW